MNELMNVINKSLVHRLHDKMWDDISAGDFACKPDILVPQKFVFGSPGVNVTLSCLVSGSPPPKVLTMIVGFYPED
jgi:hypothetical protein